MASAPHRPGCHAGLDLKALDAELAPNGYTDDWVLEGEISSWREQYWLPVERWPTLAHAWWWSIFYDPLEDRLTSEFFGVSQNSYCGAPYCLELVIGQWLDACFYPEVPDEGLPERCHLFPAACYLTHVPVEPRWMLPREDDCYFPCESFEPGASLWWEVSRWKRSVVRKTYDRYRRRWGCGLSHREFADTLKRYSAEHHSYLVSDAPLAVQKGSPVGLDGSTRVSPETGVPSTRPVSTAQIRSVLAGG